MSQHGSANSGSDESSDSDDVDNDHGVQEESFDDKKRGKKRLELSQEEMEKHFHMSQQEAARCLGVSVSTLKRRFYEVFNNMRWPYHHAVHGPNGRRGVLQLNQTGQASGSNSNNNAKNNNSSSSDDSSSPDDSNTSSSFEENDQVDAKQAKLTPVKQLRVSPTAPVSSSSSSSSKQAAVAAPRASTSSSAVKQFNFPLQQLAAAARLYPQMAALPTPPTKNIIQTQNNIVPPSPSSSHNNFAPSSLPAASVSNQKLAPQAPSYAHSNYNAYYGSVPQQQPYVQRVQDNFAQANRYLKDEQQHAEEAKPFYPRMPAQQYEQGYSYNNHNAPGLQYRSEQYESNQLPPIQSSAYEHGNEKIAPLRPVVARYAPTSQRKHVSMSSLLNHDDLSEKQISKFDYDSLVTSMQQQQQMYSSSQQDETKGNVPSWPEHQATASHIDGMRSHSNYPPQASNAALARRYQPYPMSNGRPAQSGSYSPSSFK